MADVAKLREALIARVLDGNGRASSAQRHAAFDNRDVAAPARGALIDKVGKHAYQITDDDVAAVAAVMPEDEIFELVACAALGQASRQLAVALAALAEATREPTKDHA